MPTTFTLVGNAGRSGSTYLRALLESAYGSRGHVLHEDIPVQVTRPRVHNRAYEPRRLADVFADRKLAPFLKRWQQLLETRDVVETGWTAAHLAPVLHRMFGERFRLLILHRHPVETALSRANMGNYHPLTPYDDAHEVSPLDAGSIAAEKAELWPSMNPVERCLFWWWVVYRELFEFRDRHPTVPCLLLPSKRLFRPDPDQELAAFLGLHPDRVRPSSRLPRNEVARWFRESFPIGDEWRSCGRHTDILAFAETLGYHYDEPQLERVAEAYRMPPGLGARLRHATRWHLAKVRLRTWLMGPEWRRKRLP